MLRVLDYLIIENFTNKKIKKYTNEKILNDAW